MKSAAEILGQEPPSHAVIYRDGNAIGALMPITNSVWEVHCGASPEMRGEKAVAAFRRMLTQFWSDHPEVKELIGVITADHKGARVNARHLGFTRFSTHEILWPDGVTRLTACYQMDRP